MLKTMEEHQNLAFTHIMKQNRQDITTDRLSFLLRYYPTTDRKHTSKFHTSCLTKCSRGIILPIQSQFICRLWKYNLDQFGPVWTTLDHGVSS